MLGTWANLAVAAALATGVASAPPNIVIFVPDEMHAGSMGVYGHPVTQTPNFAQLASEGTLFANAHTTHTVCTPSRCSFMTGRYVHQGGHRTLWDPLRVYEGNLLRSLKAGGYETVWFGKNDLFDDSDGTVNASVSISGDMGMGDWGPNAYPNMSDPRFYSFASLPPSWPLNHTSDMANTLAAVEYMQARVAAASAAAASSSSSSSASNQQQQPPFAIFLALTAPHPPYGCARPYYDMYMNTTLPPLRPYGLPGKPDYHELIRSFRNLTKAGDDILREVQALYLGCITYSDAVFGVLMNNMRQLGLWDDAAVFVLADHGDYSGNYGLVEKWPSGLEDVLTHVPLIAKVPGGVRGQVISGLVQHMDLTPTVLELANISANWTLSAVSQLQRILGNEPDDLTRPVFAEGGYATYEPNSFEGRCNDPLQPGICDPSSIYYPKGYQEFHVPLSVCRSTAIITPTFKLVRRSDPLDPDHFSELYDRINDPQELRNLYNDPTYAAVQLNLTVQMLNWAIQTADVTPFDEQSRTTPSTGNWSWVIPAQ